MTRPTHPPWRLAVLALILLGSLAVILSLGPWRQDPAYHRFADTRSGLGVANLADVLSNLPFLIVGLLGLRATWGLRGLPTRASWLAFFAGVSCVSAGSAWYHLAPDDATLVWDRLPMTVGFMGLFVALLAEYLGAAVQRYALAPALTLGVASVIGWHLTDDLRLYAWVQLAPLLTVPALMALLPARYTRGGDLLLALACYLAAKATESGDVAIFELTGGLVSGHTLKHLLAALGPLLLARMLVRRADRAPAAAQPSVA